MYKSSGSSFPDRDSFREHSVEH